MFSLSAGGGRMQLPMSTDQIEHEMTLFANKYICIVCNPIEWENFNTWHLSRCGTLNMFNTINGFNNAKR